MSSANGSCESKLLCGQVSCHMQMWTLLPNDRRVQVLNNELINSVSSKSPPAYTWHECICMHFCMQFACKGFAIRAFQVLADVFTQDVGCTFCWLRRGGAFPSCLPCTHHEHAPINMLQLSSVRGAHHKGVGAAYHSMRSPTAGVDFQLLGASESTMQHASGSSEPQPQRLQPPHAQPPQPGTQPQSPLHRVMCHMHQQPQQPALHHPAAAAAAPESPREMLWQDLVDAAWDGVINALPPQARGMARCVSSLV